jgi:hypothetical protein
MGIRIKRSIGWGMPWNQFVELCNAPDKSDASDWLYDEFGKLTDQDLTVDDAVHKALCYGDNVVQPPIIIQKRLLATKYDEFGKPPSPAGRAEDLFTLTWSGDDIEHIIFYPAIYRRKDWYRSDDDMDYAFEAVRGEQGEPAESEEGYGARNITVYRRYGHYPWSNYIMDHDGNPLPWDHYALLNKRDDWVPGIPSEIRWYLTQFDIMYNQGVNQLRPIVAQWWS